MSEPQGPYQANPYDVENPNTNGTPQHTPIQPVDPKQAEPDITTGLPQYEAPQFNDDSQQPDHTGSEQPVEGTHNPAPNGEQPKTPAYTPPQYEGQQPQQADYRQDEQPYSAQPFPQPNAQPQNFSYQNTYQGTGYQGAPPQGTPYSPYQGMPPYAGSAAYAGGVPPLNKPYYGIHLPAAVSRFFQKYTVFTGRASKSEFWWVVLFLFLANLAIGLITWPLPDSAATWIARIWDVAVLIPTLSLGVRRLHDTNKPAVWILLPAIPLLLSNLISWFTTTPSPDDLSGSAAGTANLIAFSGIAAVNGIIALIGLISAIVLFVAATDPAGAQYDDDFQAGQYPPAGGQPYTNNGTNGQFGPYPQEPQQQPYQPQAYPQQHGDAYPAPQNGANQPPRV